MNRIFFTIMLLSLTMVSNAESVPLCQLTASNKSHAGGIRHSPPKLGEPPIVDVGEDNLMNVFISRDGQNCSLVLLSSDGTMLYNINFVSLDRMSFLIPQDVMHKATTLVLKVDAITYVGKL